MPQIVTDCQHTAEIKEMLKLRCQAGRGTFMLEKLQCLLLRFAVDTIPPIVQLRKQYRYLGLSARHAGEVDFEFTRLTAKGSVELDVGDPAALLSFERCGSTVAKHDHVENMNLRHNPNLAPGLLDLVD